MEGQKKRKRGHSVSHKTPKDVRIICTGGTFDKIYDPVLEALDMAEEPAAWDILKAAQIREPSVSVVTRKDSLELTSQDLNSIWSAIESANETSLVVIHGTSRLVETAKHRKVELDKTVIFTGSMVPSSIDATEASFNLGFALASSLLLPNGIWVAMNGEIFSPDQVVKNEKIARFEHI